MKMPRRWFLFFRHLERESKSCDLRRDRWADLERDQRGNGSVFNRRRPVYYFRHLESVKPRPRVHLYVRRILVLWIHF